MNRLTGLSMLLRLTASSSLLVSLLAGLGFGEVRRIEIDKREVILNGRSFGLAGPYEKVSGMVHFAVDPEHPANQVITDIEKAPRDDRGRVRFHSEFFLLKPVSIDKGNGALLLEVGNRGRKGLLGFFNRAEGSTSPEAPAHFGDGFLMEEGFTLLWVGWQWDTPEVPGLMRMYPPVATEDGQPIRGLVRSDFVPLEPEMDHSLADRNHIAYPVADPNAPENVMTVRDHVEADRQTIPRSRWGFGKLANGEVVPDPRRVYLEGGFEPQKIYEVVYVSENPPLVGLGPAAVRDVASWLKYEGAQELDVGKGAIDRALAFGISQSGRFLRTFLYHGFNQDDSGRKAYDGILAHVAGGGRGSFNHRFAQASRDAHPFLNFFHPTDIFPFTDREQIDFRTGTSDGILVYQKPQHLPKVFYTNSSYEYWGRSASLIHTSVDGAEDAKQMDNVRIYHFSGTQHGPTSFPPRRSIGRLPSNPMDFRWSMRALLVAMDRWVRTEAAPPSSRHGRVEDGTLVTPEELNFPSIPGMESTSRIHRAYRADYGEQFLAEGVVTQEPPDIGAPYAMLVPAVDADGNEVVGIELPEHAVPLATYTGWNLFHPDAGPPDTLSSMQGSFVPFARTRAERERNDDPRPSIQERYASREEYLGRVANAALRSIEQGYLLGRDLPAILEEAGSHWDFLLSEEMKPE